jgi:hypothetical protein
LSVCVPVVIALQIHASVANLIAGKPEAILNEPIFMLGIPNDRLG